jgi:glycosyltransferase involved in cell wall biosynthesis
MRILLTADPWIPVPPRFYGGIERIIDGIVVELKRLGHEVGILANGESTTPADQKFAWAVTDPKSVADHIRNVLVLTRVARVFRPDIVHSFSRLLYLVPSLFTKTPAVMSFQRHTGGRQISIAALLGGERIQFTGCSKFIADMGARWSGRWEAIPNFVDTDFYSFESEVSADAPLVFLSRIEQIKGAHAAIQIAKACGRRLLIAGNRPEDLRSLNYWRERIQPEIGLNGIEYVGPVDDLQKRLLLARAAALVVPIEWDEPFGIVFVEALSCGTPVISCPRGGLPEIIEDGRHGFLVNSIAEGVKAIGKLGQISRAECRGRAVNNFSVAAVVSMYIRVYSNLVLKKT